MSSTLPDNLVTALTATACTHCAGTGRMASDKQAGNVLRRERGDVSLRRIAKEMKFSPAYICDIEHGKRRITRMLAERYVSAVRRVRSA